MESNEGQYLELMDRIHIASVNLDDHILNHPISLQNSDVKYHLVHSFPTRRSSDDRKSVV